MHTPRKFWLVLVGSILALVAIACSCNSLIPTATPTLNIIQPPSPLPPTLQASPTTAQIPSPTTQSNSTDPLAGSWQDPDTGTVTTIIVQNGGYAVDSVINPNRGGNELTTTDWSSSGVLTWTYCVPGGSCVTTEAVPGNGHDLATQWSNDAGLSGSTTLQRVSSAPATSEPTLSSQAVGSWQDPDTGTVSTIMALDGGYTLDSVINPNRGGNELASTDWSNGILSWIYCAPGLSCVTTYALSVNGDSLDTMWTNENNDSGTTTMQRVASAPALNQEPVPGAIAGRWLDPDTSGTYHLIVWENNEYIVAATLNPNRGTNEVTSSTWANGILTWTYCVPAGACVTTEAVPGDGSTLTTHWTNDQGKSGTTTLERMP